MKTCNYDIKVKKKKWQKRVKADDYDVLHIFQLNEAVFKKLTNTVKVEFL